MRTRGCDDSRVRSSGELRVGQSSRGVSGPTADCMSWGVDIFVDNSKKAVARQSVKTSGGANGLQFVGRLLIDFRKKMPVAVIRKCDTRVSSSSCDLTRIDTSDDEKSHPCVLEVMRSQRQIVRHASQQAASDRCASPLRGATHHRDG